MNTEENRYKFARLYLLNRKKFPANEEIESKLIERCDDYIDEFNTLVNELSPNDIQISIPASETDLDLYSNSLEEAYLNYLDSMDYKTLCEALGKLNRWKALKEELNAF